MQRARCYFPNFLDVSPFLDERLSGEETVWASWMSLSKSLLDVLTSLLSSPRRKCFVPWEMTGKSSQVK